MAILTAGDFAIDMRQFDYGLPYVADALSFLDAFDPVRAEIVTQTSTYFKIYAYDSVNNLVILEGTGNLSLGTLTSLTETVPLYEVRLNLTGNMYIDPWGDVYGTISSLSAYHTTDNSLLGQLSGINLPVDFSGVEDLTDPDILSGDDMLQGSPNADYLIGYGGADTILGGEGTDTAGYSGALSHYAVTATVSGYAVNDLVDHEGADTLINIERLQFTDMSVNLTVQAAAAGLDTPALQRLEELYVAFFNRVPDADGLEYWIGEFKAGMTIDAMADAFYNAGILYTDLTGYSPSMTNADFVNTVYRNVLGREDGADPEGLDYWTTQLALGLETRGSLVSTILDSAHTFKGDATWGWVADLLDNKIVVADTFAVDWGLNYNTPEDSIAYGMAIAAAVTPTDTSAAIALIGISEGQIDLG